jgi:hypothetical protein
MRLLWLLFLLLFAVTAHAQGYQRLPSGVPCGNAGPPAGIQPGYMDALGNICGSGSSSTTSPPVKGFGNLTGTGASALLSTLTTGPSSAAWPTSPGQVYVITTGGTGYVCPLGGTCSATVGIPIGSAVAGWGFNAPSTNMTVYGANTVTFTAQW